MKLPRTVWIFWRQGFEEAPPIVQTCVKSWQLHNPGWTIRLTTEANIRDFLDPDYCDRVLATDLSLRKTSNLFRMALVGRHGGVYADADCYCTRALDTWIDDATASGFFAFSFIQSERWFGKPDVSILKRLRARTMDRIIANWFIAGLPGNTVTEHMVEPHLALLSKAKRTQRWYGDRVSQKIYKGMTRNAYTASVAGNPDFIYRVGSFPFYVMHYHFAYLVRTNPAFRATWQSTPKVSAYDPLIYRYALALPIDDAFKTAMGGNHAPVYKLQHRTMGGSSDGPETRLDWLIRQHA